MRKSLLRRFQGVMAPHGKKNTSHQAPASPSIHSLHSTSKYALMAEVLDLDLALSPDEILHISASVQA